MSFALDALILATSWTHVILSPFTKVEESFNLHAVHDVLFYGFSNNGLLNYDHFLFPGAVPRSFMPSIALAWISSPLLELANSFGFVQSKFDLQVFVRLVLASINAFGLILLRRAVKTRFGRPTSLFFALITCSQFHIPFWMGRTIPNMFAFFPVVFSLYLLVDVQPNAIYAPNTYLSVAVLTLTSIVLRAEVALLLIPTIMVHLLRRDASFWGLFRIGLLTSLASVALTTFVDSYAWDEWPLWPEFHSIYFNVYEGKSADWGISPFHTYFTSSLPKLLLGALPLAIIGMLRDGRVRTLLIAPILFVLFISFLGHKEWRFIVYVVPAFNIAAAVGARWLVSLRKGTFIGRLMFLAVVGLICVNIAVTTVFTMASMSNYPGGEALRTFTMIYENKHPQPVRLHMCNLAAQTGSSLFLQTHAPPYSRRLLPPPTPLHVLSSSSGIASSPMGYSSFFSASTLASSSRLDWNYDKTENLSIKDLTADRTITHLIVEERPSKRVLSLGWQIVQSVEGFDGWNLSIPRSLNDLRSRTGKEWWAPSKVLAMRKSEKLWILEREPGRRAWIY